MNIEQTRHFLGFGFRPLQLLLVLKDFFVFMAGTGCSAAAENKAIEI